MSTTRNLRVLCAVDTADAAAMTHAARLLCVIAGRGATLSLDDPSPRGLVLLCTSPCVNDEALLAALCAAVRAGHPVCMLNVSGEDWGDAVPAAAPKLPGIWRWARCTGDLTGSWHTVPAPGYDTSPPDPAAVREQRASLESARWHWVDAGGGVFRITGSRGVTYRTTNERCSCPDYQFRGAAVGPCKHMRAVAARLS